MSNRRLLEPWLSPRRLAACGFACALIVGGACGSDPNTQAGAGTGGGGSDASTSDADTTATATTDLPPEPSSTTEDASTEGSDDSSSTTDTTGDSGDSGSTGDETGGSSLDPLDCPVGDADGCCPLAVRYGGTDPDCGQFTCDSLSRRGQPIILDPVVEESTSQDELGTAALAFTGHDLAIAWTDIKSETTVNPSPFALNYYFERRDLDGELAGDIQEGTVDGVTSFMTRGPARLEYDADEDLFPFALTNDNTALVTTALGADGDFIASDGSGGGLCGGATAVVDLIDISEGFFRTNSHSSCSGPSLLAMRVFDSAVDYHGGLAWDQHGDTFGPVAFFDPTERRLSWLSVETAQQRIQYRTFNVPEDLDFSGVQDVVPTEASLSATPVAWAKGGSNFMAVSMVRTFTSQFNHSTRVTGFDSATGEVVPGSGLFFPFDDRRLLHARIKWIGAGYIAALTSVFDDGTSSNGPNEDADPRTEILYLDTNGTIRQRFDVVERNAMYPDIAWVGDRVALSWVETQEDGRRFHMLDFLGCQP